MNRKLFTPAINKATLEWKFTSICCSPHLVRRSLQNKRHLEENLTGKDKVVSILNLFPDTVVFSTCAKKYFQDISGRWWHRKNRQLSPRIKTPRGITRHLVPVFYGAGASFESIFQELLTQFLTPRGPTRNLLKPGFPKDIKISRKICMGTAAFEELTGGPTYRARRLRSGVPLLNQIFLFSLLHGFYN